MPSAPIISPSNSITSYLSVTFIALGLAFIVYMLSNVKEHLENKNVAKVEQAEEDTVETAGRKEINNFDYSIFNEN